MGKFSKDAARLLELVGGKENVTAVSHCVTRMRFVLEEPSKADIAAIEKLEYTRGTFTQAGQFQVIIGNEVSTYYNDFIEVSGLDGVSKDAVKSAAKQNQNVIQRIMSSLAEIFAPLIPAIIVGGLILGFRNIIDSVYFYENGTKTIVDMYPFWAGIDSFLWLIGEAVFHFLPVMIVWSITKKMGTTQALGIVLGITLVSPQLLNAYGVATTAAADIPKWDFGFFQLDMIGYQAQVIPAILAGFTLVYLEKFFRKICPAVVSMIVVPFLALLMSTVIAHAVLGPIGWKIGAAISDVVNAGLSSSFNMLFAAVFGFFYAPLVITGLHHMSNAIDLQLIADFGGTNLWPMIALSNIAQGSAVLAMTFLQKKDAKAKEVSVPSCISCYLGVTEPAMFGVNLKYGFPFICGMIGSAMAAVISVGFHVHANAIGVGGLPGILSIQPQYMGIFAAAMAVAIAVPFALTYIVGRRKGIGAEKTDYQDVKTQVTQLKACLSGKLLPIEDMPDQVFSGKTLGDGIAIEPRDNVVVAPADATVTTVMDGSFHACGLTLDNGMEILIHVGIDTVAMKGDGFICHVQDGDRVKEGQKLISFDAGKIIAAGYSTMTAMVITETAGMEELKFCVGEEAEAGVTTAVCW